MWNVKEGVRSNRYEGGAERVLYTDIPRTLPSGGWMTRAK
jgi:hypothetical protein